MNIRNLIRRRHIKRRAKAAYFHGDSLCYWLWCELLYTDDATERACLLREAAGTQGAMARAHMRAFGPDPLEHESGRDLAESTRLSSRLLYMLADVEASVAYAGGPNVLGSHAEDAVLSAEAWEIVHRMASTPDVDERDALLWELGDAVEPTVGGQAAETVYCLSRLPSRPASSEGVSA